MFNYLSCIRSTAYSNYFSTLAYILMLFSSPIPFDPIHSFGADTDRFKDTYFGRLDLKAQIPGPEAYDDIFRYSKESDKSHRVPSPTSPGAWSPSVASGTPLGKPGTAASGKLGSRMINSPQGNHPT